MKYLLTILFVCFVATALAAQTPQAREAQDLNQKIAALFEQGNVDDAIPLAERLVTMMRAESAFSAAYASALTNLTVLRAEKSRRTKADAPSFNNIPWSADLEEQRFRVQPHSEQYAKLLERNSKYAAETEKMLREVLAVYERIEASQSLEAATAKNDLAWLLYNNIAAVSVAYSRARIDEAEKFYAEALAIRENLLGANHNLTLRVKLDFADFYLRWVNFEKALPLFEGYLKGVEKTFGDNNKLLLRALRPMRRVALTTENTTQAEDLRQRIVKITGQEEKNLFGFELSLRSKNSLQPRVVRNSRERPIRVLVKVLVNEDGKVLEAVAVTSDQSAKQSAEEGVLAWSFRPFIYQGAARKMRGGVYFTI